MLLARDRTVLHRMQFLGKHVKQIVLVTQHEVEVAAEAYGAWGGSSLRLHQRKSTHLLMEFDFVITENMRVSQS